jgi:hypothetical protein
MTLQQYFDATVAHLAEQKCRAHDGNRCQYLTDDGLRCAIGCHIPDGHPAQKEDMTFDTLSRKYPDLAGNKFISTTRQRLDTGMR